MVRLDSEVLIFLQNRINGRVFMNRSFRDAETECLTCGVGCVGTCIKATLIRFVNYMRSWERIAPCTRVIVLISRVKIKQVPRFGTRASDGGNFAVSERLTFGNDKIFVEPFKRLHSFDLSLFSLDLLFFIILFFIRAHPCLESKSSLVEKFIP
jgi:hypothetical protein